MVLATTVAELAALAGVKALPRNLCCAMLAVLGTLSRKTSTAICLVVSHQDATLEDTQPGATGWQPCLLTGPGVSTRENASCPKGESNNAVHVRMCRSGSSDC